MSSHMTVQKTGLGVVIYSYSTLVGFVDEDKVLYSTAMRYSPTTAQHMSQMRHMFGPGKELKEDDFRPLADTFLEKKGNAPEGKVYHIPKFGRTRRHVMHDCLRDMGFPERASNMF